jgi:hypothetical protein
MTVASAPAHKSNLPRPTEGSKSTGAVARTRNLSGEKRRAGRPVGSKTKNNSLMPADLADQVLTTFEGNIPKEHYDYLKSVFRGKGSVSTEKELDILILLLGRNLHPALVGEMSGEEEMKVDEETGEISTVKKVVFRRDVTERLKVLNSLLSLRHQVEKNKDDGKDGEQPLLKIVADRALLDGGRLGILVGGLSGPVVGDSDGTGWRAVPPRTVSSPLPE